MDKFKHGGDVYRIARSMRLKAEDFTDFSSNTNCFAEDITARLTGQAGFPFKHYPDPDCTELVESISAHEGIETARILAGNGAAQLIWLALQALDPAHCLFVGPAFSEYVRACVTLGISHEIITPPPEHGFTPGPKELAQIYDTRADLVIICTPNNPATITYENILQILRMLKAPRVLMDNSYREFLHGLPEYAENHWKTYASSLRQGVSLYTLHSFTKFFSCPGIRLGYLMADRASIARIKARQPAWSVSTHSQILGKTFIDSIDLYRDRLPRLRQATIELGLELRRLPYFIPEQVFDGPGFVTARVRFPLTPERMCYLLQKQHIIIRNCDNIPGMPKGFVRIQARNEKDREALLRGLVLCS